MLRSAEKRPNKRMQRNLNRTQKLDVTETFPSPVLLQIVRKHVPSHGKSSHPGHRPDYGNLRSRNGDAEGLLQPEVSEERPKFVHRPRRVRTGGWDEGLGDVAATTSTDKDERSAAQIRDKT